MRNKKTDVYVSVVSDRQIDRWINKQVDRQTDRQTDSVTYFYFIEIFANVLTLICLSMLWAYDVINSS